MQSDEVNASSDPCDSTDQITSPMVREELDGRPVAARRPAPVKAPPAFTWPLASVKPREPVARKPPVPAKPIAAPAIALPTTPEIIPVRARATQPPPAATPAPTPGAFPIVASTPRYSAEL